MPIELTDFRNFLALCWDHLGLPKPTPIQYDIAYYLQHGAKRRIIEAYRGVGKSWVTSAFVVWKLLLNPQEKILVVSASKERSDSFALFTKRLISEMPILMHLAPRHDQRSSNIAFDVAPSKAAHAPSVKSVGINGQITGSRATIIIADDIEVVNNSASQLQREQLSNKIREFDAVLSPNGDIIYLGTPQTEESIYNTLPERGYEIRVWPARYPKDQKAVDSYLGRLSPMFYKHLEEHGDALFWQVTDPT
ncbi:phage terminase large subunit [Iodobacter sp.]|uniref:phage terminase large subunit n=1 Tax=Iodobacter sp. TaxID=1915058 RepID=UPI0026010FF3|nr:phage terminase large subunit [Iodobacter sp.]